MRPNVDGFVSQLKSTFDTVQSRTVRFAITSTNKHFAGFARQLNSPPGTVFVYPLADWWKLPMGFPAGVNCFQNGFPLNRIEDN